ncbi:hypothetical protein AZH11_03025 [Pseudomonas simiae]|nr:hypothetical protein AZH11_03025 [Pseudomonas simiae]
MSVQKSDFESGKHYLIKTVSGEMSGIVSKAGNDGVLIGPEEVHVPYGKIISFEEVVLNARMGAQVASVIKASGKKL